MSSSLVSKITAEVITAMKAQEKRRLAALRAITAAIKEREIKNREIQDGPAEGVLPDPQVFELLDKMLKQRRESAAAYQAAGRQDLFDQEQFEISVIQEFLPKPLSEVEVADLIQKTLTELNAKTAQDMGKVMAALKPQLQGRADMGKVGAEIKRQLLG